MSHDVELLVIGSGPAGQKAAIQGAKLGKRVAIVERGHMVGGVCVNTGTIPSKSLREAIVYLTGMSQREIYGSSYRVKPEITIADLDRRTRLVIERETDVIQDQLLRNHVELLHGTARFVDPNTMTVALESGGERVMRAENIVLAVGTRPSRPEGVEFDGATVIDSDGLLNMRSIPASLVVVGAGVIGLEYASMLAALGTKVTLVEKRDGMLDFCDEEIVESLRHHLRDNGVVFRFGESVFAVERHGNETITHLASGKRIAAEAVFYSAGRQGATDELELDQAGLATDERGRIPVDGAVPHVGAAHLRGRRRDRLPQPRSHLDGAGSPRRTARLRRALSAGERDAAAVRDLRDPRDQLRRGDRRAADAAGDPVRDRDLPLPRARPRADPR